MGPSIPAWVTLIILGILGKLEWTVVGASCAAVFILMAALVLTRLADFDRLIEYAENLIASPEAPPPSFKTSATAQRMLTAITALRSLWEDRRDEATALAKSRQDILDTLPDPLLLLDSRRRLNGANAAARDLFEPERTSEASAGRQIAGRDLAGVIRDPRVLDAADQALVQKKKTAAQFSLPSPVERTFGALLVPLAAPAWDGTALIIALHDLTERLKMDRMRADFVANASHELRTPLASVLGFIETLRGPAKGDLDAQEEFLGIMLKQANRMTRLIDDLLSLSRIELREHTRPTDAVNLESVLRSTVELLERQAKERNAKVQLNVPSGLPPALADAGELSQVFHNLVTNALKYGGEHGRVIVTAELTDARPPSMSAKGDCLKVSVRDHGEGISKEFLPRLTERFYRVDTARSRSLGGTGLGLAIVKHIVNRHRGALQIESEIGRGSTFTVYLPVAASAASLPPQQQQPTAAQ